MASGRSGLEIEPAGTLGAATSAALVGGLGGAITLLFAFAAWRFLVYRGRSLRAESAARQKPALEEGPILLQGRVETDDGGPAVRIEVDQMGREWARNNAYTHEWQEKNRTVHVRPFHLRLDSGEVVRVLPDERVRIVDKLETEKVDGLYRRRVCELSARESMWVSGVLVREGGAGASAYRAGPAPLVVRGTATEPLEVASGSLDRQFSYWRKFYTTAATLLGIAFVAVHLLFVPYYARFWAGKVETATVLRTSTYDTTSKSGRTTHYVVHARLPDRAGGAEVADEIRSSAYLLIEKGAMTTVPFLHVRAIPSLSAVGSRPALAMAAAIFATGITLVAALFFPSLRRKAMPWYEQSRVIERRPGRLEDNAWDEQVPGKEGLFAPGKRKG